MYSSNRRCHKKKSRDGQKDQHYFYSFPWRRNHKQWFFHLLWCGCKSSIFSSRLTLQLPQQKKDIPFEAGRSQSTNEQSMTSLIWDSDLKFKTSICGPTKQKQRIALKKIQNLSCSTNKYSKIENYNLQNEINQIFRFDFKYVFDGRSIET